MPKRRLEGHLNFLKSIFRKPNLVIAVVGDESKHYQWLDKRFDPKFDLLLINSGTKDYRRDCHFYFELDGYKWNLIHQVVQENPWIKNYKNVWCAEDTISIDTFEINRMFELFDQYKLQLAQPSLSSIGMFTHPLTLHKENFVLRYTNYIETIAPIFNKMAFAKLLDTFIETKSGLGLDWVWPSILKNERCAVIDDVQILYQKRKKDNLYKKYSIDNISPIAEKSQLLKKYGVYGEVYLEISGVRKTTEVVGCCYSLDYLLDARYFKNLSHLPRRANRCSFAEIALSKRFLNDKITIR